jgi:hypothetical protein
MTRIFKVRKPNPAKATSQPAAADRKPAGKQPDAQDLDRAAQQKSGQADQARQTQAAGDQPGKKKEVGGPEGPEPTRYGDWERGGICYDF